MYVMPNRKQHQTVKEDLAKEECVWNLHNNTIDEGDNSYQIQLEKYTGK